ncbi:MAG TPA: protein-disulfide reductase DsbD [Planctomycetota bacterium]|nr:protein-disulfide reductase DsbD [Planctomycetota bacterium]
MSRLTVGLLLPLAAATLLACPARGARAGEAATVEARVTSKSAAPGGTVQVEVRLAPGFGVHLYRDKVRLELPGSPGYSLGRFELPAGRKAKDPNSGEEEEFFQDPVTFTAPVNIPANLDGEKAAFTLRIGFQGCTDTFCLPPASRDFQLAVPIGTPAAGQPQPQPPPKSQPQTQPPPQPAPAAGSGEAPHGALLIVLFAFLAGLGICYTPCVYPMIPVTVAVIGGVAAGRDQKPGKLQLLGYTLVYVLGMAITYSIMGMIAARSGQALGGRLQSPWILVPVSLVMMALAMSMFGAFDVVLPAAVTSRLGRFSGSGSLPALLASGLIMALGASPCISAPLGTVLLSISQTGSLVVGAAALFAFAWGMSALLIVAGVFPGLLSRPGPWMLRVKAAFGAIMAVMALYFVRLFLPEGFFALWPVLGLVVTGALLFLAGRRLAEGGRGRGWAVGLGGIALAAAAYLGAGAAVRSGTMTAFVRLAFPPSVTRNLGGRHGEKIAWEAYTPEAFDAARRAGRPVLVDFYADWCPSCLEMEEGAFAEPAVIAETRRFVRLRVNGTDHTQPAVQAAQTRFGIRGYPTVVVFDPAGAEAARTVGLTEARVLLEKMRAAR